MHREEMAEKFTFRGDYINFEAYGTGKVKFNEIAADKDDTVFPLDRHTQEQRLFEKIKLLDFYFNKICHCLCAFA